MPRFIREFSNQHITPSYMGSRQMGSPMDVGAFSTVQLMRGEVKSVTYPSDVGSVTKKFIEYEVDVEYRDGSGAAVTKKIPACMLINTFGGVADRVSFGLRASTEEARDGSNFSNGSKVLVLCLLGEVSEGYIVGGIREGEAKDSKDDGHNLFFEFNGTQATVNKDGEFKLLHRGPTNAKGDLASNADKNGNGSSASFLKDGSIKISTPESIQGIFFYHKDKKSAIIADEKFEILVSGDMYTNTSGNWETMSDKGCLIQANDNVKIKSSGVLVGAATDKWLLASTYRQSESTKNQMLMTSLTSLSTLAMTAGISLGAGGALHLIPIGGPIAGSPLVISAGVAIGLMMPLITSMMSAITSFESQSMSYLSMKNKND
jgi:hypothetical protein